MAPSNALGKRVKGTQITRPFIYGTTARPFHPQHNPKPPGVPDDHTHSWQVFVMGADGVDVTYWLRRVQFKLHESIPSPLRNIDGEPGKPFTVDETGWGEFEITIKLYYASESGEKPQTLYHHLRLHPYGRTEEEKEEMRSGTGEVRAWVYEEQVFNEPFEAFYDTLTSGAHPKGFPGGAAAAAAGGKGKGGAKAKPLPPLPQPPGARGAVPVSDVWERTALIPTSSKDGCDFSRETEALEIKKLREAQEKVQAMCRRMLDDLKVKEAELAALKADNQRATATATATATQQQQQQQQGGGDAGLKS